MFVRIVMFFLQQKGADDIDSQTDESHRNGFIEADGLRRNQPLDRFYTHQQGNNSQHHRAGKATQHTDFPGTETVAGIIRMPPRIMVGKGRDAQCHGMGPHVPSVCQQGHGAEKIPRADLDNHHRQGQQDNPAGIAFTVPVFDIIMVSMFPLFQGVNMHSGCLP